MSNSQDQSPHEPQPRSPKSLVELARTTGHKVMSPATPLVEAGVGSAPAGAVGTAPPGRGIEEPSEVAATIALVDRAFAFLESVRLHPFHRRQRRARSNRHAGRLPLVDP